MSKALRSDYRKHQNVTLYQWSNQSAQSRFHERFLLTEHVAIDFGGGLDSSSNGNEKTTVKLLGPSATEELKGIYSQGSSAFKLLNTETVSLTDRPFSVLCPQVCKIKTMPGAQSDCFLQIVLNS